jgi:hypothetical protein
MVNPTGYTALDLIGFTDRGTYATNVAYVKNDLVHYAGNIWRCLIDDTMNVTPAEGNNWTVWVGESTSLVERIIAPLEENPATVAYATGRQIIYDDWLWEVIDDIAVGDPLIDYAVDPTNANIKKAVPVETQLLDVKKKEGNLTDLHTTNKTNLVAAVNEVKDDVGTLSALDTNVKTSTVAAINEVNTKVSKTEDLIAYVQTSLIASKTYAVDEQFIYNGLLYKATAAIAQGGTITINGNCTLADSVTKQILDANSLISGKCSYLNLPNISATSTRDYITNLARQFLNYDNGVYVFVGGWIGQADCAGYVQIASAGGNNKYISFTMNMSGKLYMCTYVSGVGSFYVYEMNGTAI